MSNVITIDFRPIDPWERYAAMMMACSQLHPEEDWELVEEVLSNFILEIQNDK